MKLKITLFITLFLFLNYSFAQVYCGTPNDSPNQKFSNLSRMLNDVASEEEMLCLNVHFHIVRDNYGSPNSNPIRSFQLGGITADLNNKYNPHKINFHHAGYDYIDNTLLNDLQNSEIDPLISINNVADAINIYIVNTVTDGWNGFARNIPGTNLIVTAEAALSDIVSHEVGHCLNLWHTHETKFGVENEDNCTIAGDLICDTPPDSGLRDFNNPIDPYFVDSSCNYTKGDGYNPDTKNIMSYTRPSCLEHFTNGQAIRMRDAILNSPVLQPVLNCTCTVAAFFGKSTICSTETATYSIPCNTSSFTISSNLQVISSTNSSITVKPINASINGNAFVKATINGILHQKDIWVGKPKVDVQLTPDWNFVLLDLIGVGSNIHDQNITYIKWETLSSTGGGIMGQLIDRFENLARGYGSNWSINAKITVTNACGTTYLYKYILPPVPLRSSNYKIVKTDKNEYSVFKVIDPSANPITFENNTEKVKDKDIIEAALFNIYGIKVKSYTINLFDTNYLKNGVYVFKVQIKDELLTQKIIVE